MKFFYNIVAVGAVLLGTCNIVADTMPREHDHVFAPQVAHVHGYTRLILAIEGNRLEISFAAPASTIVGFEHRASSNEQQGAVKRARRIFESPKDLFSFSGSSCSIKQASADFASVAFSQETHSREHNHVQEHDNNVSNHSEISASFGYVCVNGNELSGVRVNLFDIFPNIEKINVMWLTDTKQGALDLTSTLDIIVLR